MRQGHGMGEVIFSRENADRPHNTGATVWKTQYSSVTVAYSAGLCTTASAAAPNRVGILYAPIAGLG